MKKLDINAVLDDIRKLSDALEYIHVLSFSGGDVMLNLYLPEILHRTASIDNIGDIYILTNGTYIPHKKILDAIQENKDRVRIVINNYDINSGAAGLVEELNRRGIHNHVRENAGWYDFLDYSFHGRTVEDLRNLYRFCSFDANERLYYIYEGGKINMRCGASNTILYFLGKYEECKEDWIDLRNLSREEIPNALTKLEDRDYLDICNFCVGAKVETRTLKAAGEQLEVVRESWLARIPFLRKGNV